jgi:hypothetical protein
MYSLKEQAIRDYLIRINFKNDWNYKVIEEDMRKFLGERPALEPTYKKDVILNEVMGEAQEIKKLEKIAIIFTDIDERLKRIEFLID